MIADFIIKKLDQYEAAGLTQDQAIRQVQKSINLDKNVLRRIWKLHKTIR